MYKAAIFDIGDQIITIDSRKKYFKEVVKKVFISIQLSSL